MSTNSNESDRSRKPARPKKAKKTTNSRPKKPAGSPLYPHPVGYWAKKVGKKFHYYGRWGRVVNGVVTPVDDVPGSHRDALLNYQVQYPYHQTGKEAPTEDQLSRGRIKDVLNRFLSDKQAKVDAGKMSARMLTEYKATTDRLADEFGKETLVASLQPGDFTKLHLDLSKQFGPVRLGNEVQKVKTIFKRAKNQKWIDDEPYYGDDFKKPPAREMRRHRALVGKRNFDPADVRALIDAADVPLKAIILLGVNCGFGNADIGRLKLSHLNLKTGWYDFRREKTWIERRAKLWPETVTAIRDAINSRREPIRQQDADLVFLTSQGLPWATAETPANAVTDEFSRLLKRVGITKETRPGRKLSFYALRHTMRTVANSMSDRNRSAIRTVMGHADGSEIDDTYIEEVDDTQLESIADHVRKWLFGVETDGEKPAGRVKPRRTVDPTGNGPGGGKKLRRNSSGASGSAPNLRIFAADDVIGGAA